MIKAYNILIFVKLFELILFCNGLSMTQDSLNVHTRRPLRIGVIGGGASGMFAAANAAATLKKHFNSSISKCEIHVYEATPKLMSKVLISGGGRCNVLHDTTKPLNEILTSYPRGSRELNGLYSKHFTPKDAYEWFTSRGCVLKTEMDGRMFPITDSSQTIADCIYDDAKKNGVQIIKGEKVQKILKIAESENFDSFKIITLNSEDDSHGDTDSLYDCVILATGSAPVGHDLARKLDHTIVDPIPSLFTLNAAKSQISDHDGVLFGLAGLSVQNAKVSLKVDVPGKKKKKVISEEGPLLITHRGISGPATLRLSAFAAREFHSLHYKSVVYIHWAPELGSKVDEIEQKLWSITTTSPRKLVSSSYPLQSSTMIPRRLWSALVIASGFNKDTLWSEAPKKKVNLLARNIAEFPLDVTGKSIFKDEFVTAGGVLLKEITMSTMESKRCPGLYFCGEVMDVDGVTGGFNFMNCWSTGYTAGYNAAMRLSERGSHYTTIGND